MLCCETQKPKRCVRKPPPGDFEDSGGFKKTAPWLLGSEKIPCKKSQSLATVANLTSSIHMVVASLKPLEIYGAQRLLHLDVLSCGYGWFSGFLTSPFLIGDTSSNDGFPIAMLVYRGVWLYFLVWFFLTRRIEKKLGWHDDITKSWRKSHTKSYLTVTRIKVKPKKHLEICKKYMTLRTCVAWPPNVSVKMCSTAGSGVLRSDTFEKVFNFRCWHTPYHPCMVYLPTFTIKATIHV